MKTLLHVAQRQAIECDPRPRSIGSWTRGGRQPLKWATVAFDCGHVTLKTIMSPRTESKQKALLPQTELATRYVSVKILSTVETSCKTNPQLIEVMELKGYSWPTCSKQPRLVDYCIGLHIAIVNKLDRRRRRRGVLLKTRSTYRGHIFPKFPYNTPRDRWKYVSMTKPSSIRSVVSMQHRLASYRRTHGDSNYRVSIASRGKKNQC